MSEAHFHTAPARGPRDIGEILLRLTPLTEEQLDAARAAQRETGGRLGDLLVARGYVSADQLLGGPGKEPGQFGEAHMVAVSRSGDVYVADSVNGTLQKFVKAGKK